LANVPLGGKMGAAINPPNPAANATGRCAANQFARTTVFDVFSPRATIERKLAAVKPSQQWWVRQQVHLAVAFIPVFAISAQLAALVLRRPDASHRLLLGGFVWALLACVGSAPWADRR
jgi:hypothetical protein